MAYSKDYKQMILYKLAKGYSFREISEEYGHSTSTLQSWKKGKSKPYKRKPSKIDEDLLIKDVKMYPDAYLYERALRFNCTDSGIAKALKRLGITQKKDTKTSES